MNAINLYITTSRLIFDTDENSDNWSDLYRLVPYLRQSLSCKICCKLLIEPFTPINTSTTNFQFNVCKLCIVNEKYKSYKENQQLRILLQCYKNLCEHIKVTSIYKKIINKNYIFNNLLINDQTSNLITTKNLLDLIDEGCKFQDNFSYKKNLIKLPFNGSNIPHPNNIAATTNNYSVRQSLYPQQQHQKKVIFSPVGPQLSTNSLVRPQHSGDDQDLVTRKNSSVVTIANSSSGNNGTVYSVLYTTGNKITIKRKIDTETSLGNVSFNTLQHNRSVSFFIIFCISIIFR